MTFECPFFSGCDQWRAAHSIDWPFPSLIILSLILFDWYLSLLSSLSLSPSPSLPPSFTHTHTHTAYPSLSLLLLSFSSHNCSFLVLFPPPHTPTLPQRCNTGKHSLSQSCAAELNPWSNPHSPAKELRHYYITDTLSRGEIYSH